MRSRDRRFKGPVFFTIKMLIISVLYVLSSTIHCKSQNISELAIKESIQVFLSKNSLRFGKASGYGTNGFLADLVTEPGDLRELRVGPPDVSWTRLRKNAYVREIEIQLIYHDSIPQSFGLNRRDTLTRAEVKSIRRESGKELRGENPFLFHQIILPGIGIVGGFAAIISLFYLRS